MSATTSDVRQYARCAVRVRGGVQGVGFRPFVYGLATRFGLAGLVGNDTDGVFIEIEGPLADVNAFIAELPSAAPPLSHIDEIEVSPAALTGATGFRIVRSASDPAHVTPVAADVATCSACLAELRDPGNRRYRYPFTNCTNCGPRYTIVTGLPYDRAQTTMTAFTMCPDCAHEYADPTDRRYHAQPNACPACGPQLSWRAAVDAGVSATAGDALEAALQALDGGAIVAVQGIGGFHIACRADDEGAVSTLRARKHRPGKPLAVMVASVEIARTLAQVSEAEAALLSSPAAPIVVLRRRPDASLAPSLAPGHDTIGIMLAYSPLHHLLSDAGPLVLTSGNIADEPIAYTQADALSRFAGLVDAVLTHDRPIHAPADDSVMRIAMGAELPLRRSRGYAPYPVPMPATLRGPAVLAVGGELKATVCLTRDAYAFLSPHIGDVENLETERAMTRTVTHLRTLFGVLPTVVAADMSPSYRSTEWARRFARERGVRLQLVQHHHAHVAALMAEHGLTGETKVLGVTFDGTGYGTDGSVWGGEFLLADYHEFERVGHLEPTLLPGGDVAVKHPSYMALSHLHSAGIPWTDALLPVRALTSEAKRVLQQQLTKALRTTPTTSAGRLLDACAALCGVRQTVTYEGQAAIEFEALAAAAPSGTHSRYRLAVADTPDALQVVSSGLWQPMLDDLSRGRDVRSIALDVHTALADAVVSVAAQVRDARGVRVVGLTGGVFQNVLLLTLTTRRLRDAGFDVLTHGRVPPNDGGLALGQAVIAAAAVTA